MNIERAYTCGFYLPGHDVHWNQAKLAGMYVFNLGAASSVTSERDPMPDTNRQAVPGHLLEVQPDGLVVVEVDGVVRRCGITTPTVWSSSLLAITVRSPTSRACCARDQRTAHICSASQMPIIPTSGPARYIRRPRAPWSYSARRPGSRCPDRKPSVWADSARESDDECVPRRNNLRRRS